LGSKRLSTLPKGTKPVSDHLGIGTQVFLALHLAFLLHARKLVLDKDTFILQLKKPRVFSNLQIQMQTKIS
jgi:hypothetical protein